MFSTIQSQSGLSHVRRVLAIAILLAIAFAIGFAARQFALPRPGTPDASLHSALAYPLLGLPLVHAVLTK